MDYDEKPKRSPEYPCPVCDATHFEWGKAIPHAQGGRGLRFVREQDIGLFGGQFAPSREIVARYCVTCGNVLFFAKRKG